MSLFRIQVKIYWPPTSRKPLATLTFDETTLPNLMQTIGAEIAKAMAGPLLRR